jgi:beta-phosphoglucomutase
MTLNSLGITLSYKEYLNEYLGLSDKELFPQLLMNKGRFLSTKETNFLVDKKIENYSRLINSCNKLPFIPGIDQYIINTYKAGIKLAICTGSTKTELLPVLERFQHGNMTNYFDVIVTSEDVQYGKPSPEGYLLAIERLGVNPLHCKAFEDSSYGIEAAKKAGLSVIALNTSHTNHELQNADQIISNFEPLLSQNAHISQNEHKTDITSDICP